MITLEGLKPLPSARKFLTRFDVDLGLETSVVFACVYGVHVASPTFY